MSTPMTTISLSKANKIIEGALAMRAEKGFRPLGVAVLDAGGHLKAFQAEDGTSILRPEVAAGKAYGALAVGEDSRWLNEQAAARPHFLAGLAAVSQGRIVPVPGGVLVLEGSTIVGAVGISGDTSDNDEICAKAGIDAAGLSHRDPKG